MSVSIRPAANEDARHLHELIYEFAEYVRHECTVSEEQLAREMFGERPAAEALIAEENGAPIGFAIFFQTFSTFSGRKRLYLEDLFVRPEFRGKGYGKKLLVHLAKRAVEAKASRVEWTVLDWNKPSIEFYELLGARRHDGWDSYRLTDDALAALAKS